MPDPLTTNRKFSVPLRGADVGTWDLPNNGDWNIADGILGSTTTLNLAGSGPIALTDAQQQVSIIRLTGILTGNVQVTVTQPAFWIIDNRTSGNFVVTITGGAGQQIATPQGSKYQIFFDGTDIAFVNLGEPGSYKKFAVSSPIVPWMISCTVDPYLPCAGGTALIATYPALAALLGTSFGGNGITTFGIPDLRGRTDFDLDAATGRLTSATMTPDGNTLGAVGGLEARPIAQANLPTVGLPYSGVAHSTSSTILSSPAQASTTGGPNAGFWFNGNISAIDSSFSGTTGNMGSGTVFNEMPPATVTGITFIKT